MVGESAGKTCRLTRSMTMACKRPQASRAGKIGKTQETIAGKMDPRISLMPFFLVSSGSRFSSIAAVLSTPDSLIKAS